MYSSYEKLLGEKSFYTAYFNSKEELLRFQKDFKNNDFKDKYKLSIMPIERSYLDTIKMYYEATAFLFPITFVSFLLTSSFYVFSKYAQMFRTKKNFSVFHLYGIPWFRVYTAYCLYFVLQICKCVGGAVILSFVVGYFGNILNGYFKIFPFQLFSMNIVPMLLVAGIILCIMFVLISFMVYRFRKHKWFDHLKVGRDLL